jgi:xanthine dehydrogenase accessory factor
MEGGPVEPRSANGGSLLESVLGWLAEGRAVALATVLQTWGSAPQPVGSQLAIDGQGNFLGSVSGGCVEAAIIAEAADVLATGKSKTLQFGVEDHTAWSVGLACGGTIRILLALVAAGQATALLRRLALDVRARRPVAVVTELATGTASLVHAAADREDELAPALDEAFRCDRSMTLTGNRGEVFVHVFNPAIRLVIVGAVHVAQALVPLARAIGYGVVVVDPRAAFATGMRFPGVDIVADWPDEALGAIGIDARTAVVVLSHDPKIDDPALIHALRSESFYVGALGSKKTHAQRVQRLTQARIAAADLARIHAPIGLDIGAQGAAEIALSIIAEIMAMQRGKANGAR